MQLDKSQEMNNNKVGTDRYSDVFHDIKLMNRDIKLMNRPSWVNP